MKRYFFYGFPVLAIAAVAVINMNLSSKERGLSDISLANVEALADDESGGIPAKICHFRGIGDNDFIGKKPNGLVRLGVPSGTPSFFHIASLKDFYMNNYDQCF